MRRGVLFVLAALVVVMLATGVTVAAAATYTTNVQCLACHTVAQSDDTPGQNFTAAGISLANCARCHANLNAGTGNFSINHQHFSPNCAGCHSQWSSIYEQKPRPAVNTTYGWYVSGLTTLTPNAIHEAHSGNNWVANSMLDDRTCKNCHKATACSRCHGGDSAMLHGRHASSQYATITVRYSNGTTYTPIATRCTVPQCHDLAAAGTDAFTPFCGDCHTLQTNIHDGNHSYSAASDYNSSTEVGCSNSGAGCHGTDSEYIDFRETYGHVGCQSGACHLSSSKATTTPPFECVNCHSGGYLSAPDTRQHYVATEHTVDAGSMSTAMSAGGTASATCGYCHASMLSSAHIAVTSNLYGSSMDCAECHGDVATNGLAQVNANWPVKTCASCHTVGSNAPFHGTSAPAVVAQSVGCASSGASCHDSSDLHGLHKNATGCGVAGCHDALGVKPVKRTCGMSDSDCHINKVDVHYDVPTHTATGDIMGTDTVACSTCHSNTLQVAHTGGEYAGCASCHNSTVAAPVIAGVWNKDCSACHSVRHVDATAAHIGSPAGTSSCTGTGCHGADGVPMDVRALHAGTTANCAVAGCHDASKLDDKPAVMTCGQGGGCHTDMVPGGHGRHEFSTLSEGCTDTGAGCHASDGTFNLDQYHAGCAESLCHASSSKVNYDESFECMNCHDGTFAGALDVSSHYNVIAHTATGDIAGSDTVPCTQCHSTSLRHAHASTDVSECDGCHNNATSIPVINGVWSKDCSDCHASRHAAATSVHAGVPEADLTCTGANCHGAEGSIIDLRVIHSENAASCGVANCHDSGNKDGKPPVMTCGENGGCHSDVVPGAHNGHNAEASTGCANTGSGCHVSNGTDNIVQFHGASGCADSACHTSASRIGFAETFDCMNCHDSSFIGAPDTSIHYVEGLHTAADSTMARTVSSDGLASAPCSSCHRAALGAAHADTSCTSCHSKAVTQVATNWATKSCDACHVGTSITPYHGLTTPVVNGTSTQGCVQAGCHVTYDLHVLHKDKGAGIAGCLNGCHGVGGVTANRDCGSAGCHADDTPTIQGHYDTTAHTATGDITGTNPVCTKCHSASLGQAHVSMTCPACHASSVAAPVIATGWNGNCSACHATKHQTMDADHVGAPVSPNTCAGTDCHASAGATVDVSVTHAGTTSGCYTTGCHTALNSRPATKTCGKPGGGCHVEFADGNHGEHTFTAASNTAGCTNSGAGCHVTDTTYKISTYHTGCVDSACHTSASKATFSETFECVSCHDGTFAGASNAVGNAHYGAATHTATGDITGSETIACTQCHSAALKAAHAGTSAATCAGCHNSATATAVITAATAWNKSCSACHTVRHGDLTALHQGITPVETSCTGTRCHKGVISTDLRVIHASTGCRTAGCHDAADAAPTVKACKTCHPGMEDGSHCSGPVAEPYNGCDASGCHTADAMHDATTHPKLCGSCHWLQYDQSCICHGKAQMHGIAAHDTVDCMTCHISGTSMPHGNITLKPWSESCRSCHGSTHQTGNDCTHCHSSSGIHAVENDHTTSSSCDNCHNIPAGTTALNCSTCHPGGSAAQDIGDDVPYNHCRDCHGSSHHSGDDCRECHSASRIHGESDHSDRGCVRCHGAVDSMGGEGGTIPGLVPDPYGACTGCHSVYTDVHRYPSHPKECTDCHNEEPGQACSGSTCHTKTAVHPVYNHNTSCSKCHETGLPKPHATVTTKLATDNAWDIACGRCHGDMHDRIECSKCHSPVNRNALDTNGDGVINYYDSWGSNDWGSGGQDVHNVDRHMYNTRCSYCHTIASADAALNCLSCHPNGRPAAVSFVTETTGTIAGQVKDAAGVPIANANVNVDSITIQTSADGYYRIVNLTPGVRTVTVTKLGWITQTQTVDVKTGLANILDFTLSPATGGITGTVKDAAGAALSGVTVAVAGDGSTVTNSSGAYTFSGFSPGTYTLTYSLAGYTSQTTSVTVAAAVVTKNITLVKPVTNTNLAVGKTASSSSQYSSSYSAVKAIDGSTSTYWRSSSSGTQWLLVDLGSAQSIGKVVIVWNSSYYAKGYRVETSLDGTNWTSKYTTSSGGSSGTKTHTFAATNARYVRLYCTSAAGSSYRVGELQVWNF